MRWITDVFYSLAAFESESVEQQFNHLSEQILSAILRAGCIIFLCTTPLWWKAGSTSTNIGYLSLLVCIWLLTLFGTKRVQTYGLFASVYVAGLINYLSLSESNAYTLLFMLCVILTSMIKGYKSAFISTIWILLTYVSIIPLEQFGYLSIDTTSYIDAKSYINKALVKSIFGFAGVTLLGAVFVRLIVQSIKEALQIQMTLTADLQKTSDKLTDTLAELRTALERESASSEALKQALEREQEAHRIRTQLILTVSHEFRTPLTLIKVSASLLGRHSDKMGEEKREAYHDNIESGVFRLVELTERIVNIDSITEEHEIQQIITHLST